MCRLAQISAYCSGFSLIAPHSTGCEQFLFNLAQSRAQLHTQIGILNKNRAIGQLRLDAFLLTFQSLNLRRQCLQFALLFVTEFDFGRWRWFFCRFRFQFSDRLNDGLG